MKQVYQQSKTALGSKVHLTLSSDEKSLAIERVFSELWQEIDEFNRRFSRFRLDSEITQLNQKAGKTIIISPAFHDLLVISQKMSVATDGMFNPFILPALQRVGYIKSWIPTAATADPPDYSDRQVVDALNLKLTATTARIPANSAIDLGGCGKGYLLDQLGDYLSRSKINDYWLSLGGDILARGSQPDGHPWTVSIANALHPSQTLARVIIPTDKPLAIATSGITKRQGRYNGSAWHHIISSESGEPARTDILTATVCMSTGLLADVYASCLVALGSGHYQGFADQHIISDVLVQTQTDIDVKGQRIVLE
ncbi:MAG: FAD:protein FMN transferase [Candidatus Saccharibacteria bacterium]